MDKNVHDKKWFVYLNDHHEGPFTVAEIVERQHKGIVMPASSYVWCEGMKDWALMGEVEDFKIPTVAAPPKPKLTPPPAAITRETPSAFLEPSAVIEVQTLSQIAISNPAPPDAQNFDEAKPVEFQSPPPATSVAAPESAFSSFEEKNPGFLKRHRGKVRLLAAMLILGSAGVLTYPYVDRIPFLADMISPIKPHPQLSEEDLARLRSFATLSISKAGGKIALAIGKDKLKPIAFVGTNLPDGTRLMLRAEGLKGTLLNQTQAAVLVPMTIQRHYAETPLVLEGGRPVPQGDYMIYIYESNEGQPPEIVELLSKQPPSPMTVPGVSPNPKWVETRASFLSGTKDQIYIERLKKYHDELRVRAKNELVELGQLYQTLLNQMRESSQTFERFKKLKPAKAAKPWAAFHARWSGLVDSMLAEFKSWTQERLKSERFYYPLFLLAKDTGERLQAVQKAQDAAMSQPSGTVSDLDAQRAQLKTHLELLDGQIKKAQAILATPESIPEIPDPNQINP